MRRLSAAVAVAVAAVLLVAATPGVAHAQRETARFFVDSVGDSTFVFRVGGAAWLRDGSAGIAVDPGRRDARVARFRVLSVRDGRATALITGQTTFVTTEHVALVEVPRRRFWRDTRFWAGTLIGGVFGVALGTAF